MASITRDYLIVGDKADNGAVIMTGSLRSIYHGKNDAMDGSGVACPVCKTMGILKCIGPRLSNKIDGIQKALSGDICICKCPRHPVFLPARSNYTMTVDTDAAYCLHLGEAPLIGATTAIGLSPNEDHTEKFDQHFQLHDEKTGEILKNRFYKIHCSMGIIEGHTDASGFTKKVTSNEAEEIKIEIFGEGI
ncbi:putative Zn-binding protein involved in type VI secretion [Oxalobacteraceae bacterium GrIS 1.11]